MAFLLALLPVIGGLLASTAVEAGAATAATVAATGIASAALAAGPTIAAPVISALAAASTMPAAVTSITAGIVGAGVSAAIGVGVNEIVNKIESSNTATGTGTTVDGSASTHALSGGGQNVSPYHYFNPGGVGGGGSPPPASEVNPGDYLSSSMVYSHAANFSGGRSGKLVGGTGGKISPAQLQNMAASAYGINGPSARNMAAKQLRGTALGITAAVNSADETLGLYQSRRIR